MAKARENPTCPRCHYGYWRGKQTYCLFRHGKTERKVNPSEAENCRHFWWAKRREA